MSKLVERFADLQTEIAADNPDNYWMDNRLSVVASGGMLHVEFHAVPFWAYFEKLLVLLCKPEIASALRSAVFRSPDAGINGTQIWNLSPVVNSDAIFPNLRYFSVALYDGYSHNHPIVCDDAWGQGYKENGVLATLLAKSPNLVHRQG